MADNIRRSEDDEGNESAKVTPPRAGIPSGIEPFAAALQYAETRDEKFKKLEDAPASPPDAAIAAFGKDPDLETIIYPDDRIAVPASSLALAPYRRVCKLAITAANGAPYIGTGWLIGPRTVMTAGHCVYLPDAGGWAKSIEVTPALHGTATPRFGKAKSVKLRSVAQWIEHRDTDNDYGAILIDQDLGSKVGYFAFAALPDGDLMGTRTEASISGYPADKGGASQWYHARPISRVASRRVYYEMDTFGGQSGSPVWLNVGGTRVAVAIHTMGTSSGNSGTRITAEVLDNMRIWKAGG